jgi:hypothetical protein
VQIFCADLRHGRILAEIFRSIVAERQPRPVRSIRSPRGRSTHRPKRSSRLVLYQGGDPSSASNRSKSGTSQRTSTLKAWGRHERLLCAQKRPFTQSPYFTVRQQKTKGHAGFKPHGPHETVPPGPPEIPSRGAWCAGGGACLGCDGITHGSDERTRLNQPLRFKQRLWQPSGVTP